MGVSWRLVPLTSSAAADGVSVLTLTLVPWFPVRAEVMQAWGAGLEQPGGGEPLSFRPQREVARVAWELPRVR